MKFKVMLALMIISGVVSSAQDAQPARAILSASQKEALAQNKNIFVIFHASWCGWCHKMDTAMNDPAVKKYFTDNYVIRHLVVMESKDNKKLENPGALELMKKYSGEQSGIPFWIIFDKAGSVITDSRERLPGGKIGGNVGCPASEKEVAHFIAVLKKTSSINAAGLALIEKRFRKIETNIINTH